MRYPGIDPLTVALAAFWLVGFGTAAAYLAIRRRRRPRTWAVLGGITGPAALGLLWLAPPGRCWKCTSPTTGWLTNCMWCGEDVREPEPDVDVTDVRVRGPLTVIEGRKNRPGTDERGSDERASATRADPWPRSPLGGSSGRDAVSPSVATAASAAGETASVVPTVAASASSQSGVAGTGPGADSVRQLRSRLGPTSVASSSSGAAASWAPEPHELRDVVLATAIFMTGNRGLQVGGRYGIAIVDDELRILGPVDVDPAAIAITHPLHAADASGFQERLILTGDRGRRRERLALVFMSVAGGSTEHVADSIVRAVAAAQADRQ